MYTSSILVLLLCTVGTWAINHWVLQNDGRILQKVDSPFHMREPDNLVAFLDQIRYNDYVERSYSELLRQRSQIVEHLRFSAKYGEDLVEQAACALDYYMMEKRQSYLKVSSAYLKRLNIPKRTELTEPIPNRSEEPICDEYVPLAAGPCCYDHLESFQPDVLKTAQVDREENMNIGGELGAEADVVRRLSLEGLRQNPNSWKSHTMSSYYWRLKGDAKNAMDCARIAVMLAPRVYKDIPLLSLGTTLFRTGRLVDADVILTAAVEHAPRVAENHMALASALAMKHDFNRSLYHFDEAERLDPGLLSRTLPVRNFIGCLDNLNKKTSKMYSYVEYMKNEVKEFKQLKSQILQHHEKLIQQQVPLNARYLDSKIGNEDLLKRGQYCSTRTTSSAEPVLFCDFYSDIQMNLESKDVDVEMLERELRVTSEAVIKQISNDFRKQLNFEKISTTAAQIPEVTKTNVPKLDAGTASAVNKDT